MGCCCSPEKKSPEVIITEKKQKFEELTSTVETPKALQTRQPQF